MIALFSRLPGPLGEDGTCRALSLGHFPPRFGSQPLICVTDGPLPRIMAATCWKFLKITKAIPTTRNTVTSTLTELTSFPFLVTQRVLIDERHVPTKGELVTCNCIVVYYFRIACN